MIDFNNFASKFFVLRVGLQLKIDEHDRGFSTREPPAILSYEPKTISKMLLVSEPDEFGVFCLFISEVSEFYIYLSNFTILS